LQLPHKVVAAAKAENCDLILLSGDLFDGPSTPESVLALKTALKEAQIPVFISPGNHDFVGAASPWLTEVWPENVHIFTSRTVESLSIPALDCRVYGAAFTAMEDAGLLENFQVCGEEAWHLGVFHGDPTIAGSPYGPITAEQVRNSGLSYLALGHIHKGGSFQAGGTLCAWPGCPMGRGFDELDIKGVNIVTLEESCSLRFLPLDTPRFYDWELEAGEDAAATLSAHLPGAASADFYRITLTGESEPIDQEALLERFSDFPNLQLRDRTVPPIDLWASIGSDTLEGAYFGMLQQAMAGADPETCRKIALAARISRQLLDGREVKLP
jgi:DNA repair exonuclease SbcCD nuclease subunit